MACIAYTCLKCRRTSTTQPTFTQTELPPQSDRGSKLTNVPTQNDVTHRSAPAHDNILLMRMTWNGCKRTRRWKASLPQDFTRYLLAQMRPASNASDDICSNSSDTRWIHNGSSSTLAFFRPRSKIRIFGSTTATSDNVVTLLQTPNSAVLGCVISRNYPN